MANVLKEFLTVLTTFHFSYVHAADSYCKLTVNGGIGMNGPCTFNADTGEFSDGLLRTACRSGMSECHPDDMEVIRGGVFGHVVAKDGLWEFCWNNGGYTQINECFEGLKREYSCWIRPHKVVLCVNQ